MRPSGSMSVGVNTRPSTSTTISVPSFVSQKAKQAAASASKVIPKTLEEATKALEQTAKKIEKETGLKTLSPEEQERLKNIAKPAPKIVEDIKNKIGRKPIPIIPVSPKKGQLILPKPTKPADPVVMPGQRPVMSSVNWENQFRRQYEANKELVQRSAKLNAKIEAQKRELNAYKTGLPGRFARAGKATEDSQRPYAAMTRMVTPRVNGISGIGGMEESTSWGLAGLTTLVVLGFIIGRVE